jgi:hypothetical protein
VSRTLINLAAFQAGWFSCVLGAANGYPLIGPLVVFVVVAIHLAMAAQPERELMLILLAGMLGAMLDSALVRTGWLTYPNGVIWAGTAPYWIIAMWLSFATTLNVSLRWLRGRSWAALTFGAVGGPISYLAGARLGGLEFVKQGVALAALAVGWALVTPLLVVLSQRLDGVQARSYAVHRHA